ncbi:MAG TPA: hypothetical protein VIP11_03095, partial [Gemmatimonadaceae bacterium]
EPVQPGSEEYLDSEKYQLRPRNYEAPGNLNADIRRLNTIRREQPALQEAANLSFHTSENEAVLFYRKAGRLPQPIPARVADAAGIVSPLLGHDLLVVVNTDPFHAQETMVHVPIYDMGIDHEQPYTVEDLLTGVRYTWRGVRNYVRLDPAVEPGHLFVVNPGTSAPLGP